MSAIGTAYIVPRDMVAAFLAGRCNWSTLVAGADRVKYGYSGWVLGTLDAYLDAQGIALGTSSANEALNQRREVACMALEPSHRRYLERLVPERFDSSALRAFYETFTETQAEGVEAAMLAGIQFYADTLARLPDDSVAIVEVG